MFARYPNIKRSLIVTMVCCLLGEVLPLRAQGQAIEAKPPEQPTHLTPVEARQQ